MDVGFGGSPRGGPDFGSAEFLFPPALDGLAVLAAARLGISRADVVKDYYMHKALHAVAVAYPKDSKIPVRRGDDIVQVPGWAFVGGTALVAGHGLLERYSDDIDLVVFVPTDLGGSPQLRVCRDIREVAVAAITGGHPEAPVKKTGGTVKTAEIQLQDIDAPVRVDIAPTFESADRRLYKDVTSLLGRYADPKTLEEYPELRTTSVPLLPAELTAVGKLATMHGRAVHHDFDGLAERIRDLYDVAALAEDGELAEAVGAEIARRGATSHDEQAPAVSAWWSAPRPGHGYAASPAFDPTTEEYRTLKEAYEGPRLRRLLLDTSPRISFTGAVELAMGLDDHRPAPDGTPR